VLEGASVGAAVCVAVGAVEGVAVDAAVVGVMPVVGEFAGGIVDVAPGTVGVSVKSVPVTVGVRVAVGFGGCGVEVSG
jgi:hypothetical protein